jgi:hypothetical protein
MRQELPHSEFVVNNQQVSHKFISNFRLPIANLVEKSAIGNWQSAIL